ncbi:MAG TPA: hypothetical protein VEK07_03100 [Polyangiaceae bacterium]|nr:hypothetical protein [Polyangiaceae bacterium]
MGRSFWSDRAVLRAWPGVLTGLLVLASADGARAMDPPTALAEPAADEKLIAAGIELRKNGQDAEALVAFERAYALNHTPRAIAQVALAHQALAQWRDAESTLLEALRDPNDPWIVRQRAYLEQSLATVQSHLGWLDVQGDVTGAEVWVAGELRGWVPLSQPLRIVAGDISVEIRAAGFAPMRRMVHVEPTSVAHETFTFGARTAGEHAAAARELPPAPTSSAARTVGWGLLAGAGGLLLAGAAGLVTREWEAQIYDGDGCSPSAAIPRSVRCRSNREIGMTAQTIAIVSFVAAGAAAATGGFLLLRTYPHSSVGALPCGLIATAATTGIVCGGAW